MKKRMIFIVVYIGLLVAATFIISACVLTQCIGNGECTVFIRQDHNGLHVDTDHTRSTCGKSATYNDQGKLTGGCKVQNNINNHERRYGSHGCDC